MTASVYSGRYNLLRSLLIQHRQDSGMTQAELAQKLNRPQSFVSKYETGERRIDVVELLEICDAVGFDARDLLAKLMEAK